MPKVRIGKNRCKGCYLCIAFCPKKNIRVDSQLNESGIFAAVIVDGKNCIGCGMGFQVCPEAWIEIEGSKDE